MPQEIVVIRAMPQTGDVDGSQGVGVDGDYQAGFRGVRFIDNGNGTVSDLATGLMWIKDTATDLNGTAHWPGTTTWANALSACEALTFPAGGFTDWRLPNIFELISLYDANKTSDSISTPLVPEANTRYWSSTNRKANPLFAHYVYFVSYLVSTIGTKASDTFSVIPVRGGIFNA